MYVFEILIGPLSTILGFTEILGFKEILDLAEGFAFGLVIYLTFAIFFFTLLALGIFKTEFEAVYSANC